MSGGTTIVRYFSKRLGVVQEYVYEDRNTPAVERCRRFLWSRRRSDKGSPELMKVKGRWTGGQRGPVFNDVTVRLCVAAGYAKIEGNRARKK